MTYSEFLFEAAPQKDAIRWSLTPEATEQAIQQYQQIDPSTELLRLRVDYIWLSSGTPLEIRGYAWKKVFDNSAGSLWQIVANQQN
jgi:hypothetical protein